MNLPTNKEMSNYYKRVYAILLQARDDPAKLDEHIRLIALEMDEEDAAYVEKKLGIKPVD